MDIQEKKKEIADLNDQLRYWKQKAVVDENCISIITNLKFRTSNLIRENDRLKKILYQDEEYADVKGEMYGAKQI